MPPRFRRSVLLALLLLAGCNPTRVGRDYGFEGKAAETDAVMVAQIRPATRPRGDLKALGLMLQRYEPVSGQLVDYPVYVMTGQFDRPGFSLIRVPAGDYVLRAVITRREPLFGTKEVYSTFLDGSYTGRGNAPPMRGAVGDGLRLRLGAGEVSYIGDYVVEVLRRPHDIVTVERRDEVAQRTIARARPKLRDAPFVFRGPAEANGTPVAPGSRPRIVGVEDDGSIQVRDLEQPGLETLDMPR